MKIPEYVQLRDQLKMRKAPVKTGARQGVKVPCEEGVANHLSPESCAGGREAPGEALTGGMRAGLLSREND